MNRTNLLRWVFGLLTIFALASLTPSQENPPPQNDAEAPEGIEILTRGPIHEAFAQPVIQQPVAPTPIAKAPPEPIAEEPPQVQPDIENVQWIPGYWAWDAERQDFLWVSGVQRAAPQGRTFVPGYWEQTPEGWRWVNGFWSNSNQQELPYTPEPPAPLDEGVIPQAPDDNAIYIPGSWIYRTDRFVWRAGYWSAPRIGRVWIPSQYMWTPNGCLFNDGYWDEPYDRRGIAYAPVFFHQPLWRNAGWRYRPNHIVSFGVFFDSAFVRGNSFYFGNFYGPQYARLGYNPWYAGRGRYDPVFSYYGWQNHRNDRNWINNQQQTYADRSAGRGNPPPRNFAQQNALVNGKKGNNPVVVPAAQFRNNDVRLVQATPAQLETQRNLGQRTREIAVNRQQTDLAVARQTPSVGEPRTLKLSNIVRNEKGPGQGSRPNETKGNPYPKAEIRNYPPTGNNPPQTQPKIDNRPNVQPKVEIRNNPPPVNQYPVPLPKTDKGNNPPVTLPKAEIRNNPPATLPKGNNPPMTLPKTEIRNNPPVTLPKNNNPPVTLPKPEIRNNPPPIVNPQPKNVNPAPIPRNVAPPVVNPQPKNVNPAPIPRNVAPPVVNPQPKNVNPAPIPRNVAPPVVNQPPRNVAPPPTPRPSPPVQRPSPPPAAKKASIPQPQPRPNVVSQPPPRPQAVKTAPPPVRVQTPAPAPRVQPAPARQNNPAPAKSAPRSAPSGGRKK